MDGVFPVGKRYIIIVRVMVVCFLWIVRVMGGVFSCRMVAVTRP